MIFKKIINIKLKRKCRLKNDLMFLKILKINKKIPNNQLEYEKLMACAELDRNYTSITIQSSLACNMKYRAFYNNIDIAFQKFLQHLFNESTRQNFFASLARLERHSSFKIVIRKSRFNELLQFEMLFYLKPLIIFISQQLLMRSICFVRITN